MTPRQAHNIIVWLVLLPITVGAWIKVVAPCVLGCAQELQKLQEPLPEPARIEPKRYTVCGSAGWCLEAPWDITDIGEDKLWAPSR
jgi:hypothetical protein